MVDVAVVIMHSINAQIHLPDMRQLAIHMKDAVDTVCPHMIKFYLFRKTDQMLQSPPRDLPM
jgi:hypothetical protein